MRGLPKEQFPASNFALIFNCPIVKWGSPSDGCFHAIELHPYLTAIFWCRRYGLPIFHPLLQ